MPDVVELARALVEAIDKYERNATWLDTRIRDAAAPLRAELERIEKLRATPPEPGSLDAALLAELERVRRQGT